MNTRTERIRQLRSDGKTLTEIAREYGLSRERIRQICVKAGIPTVTPRPPSVPLVCAACGAPYSGAREHLGTTGHHPRKRRTLAPWQPNERARRIIALYDSGHTIMQIHLDMGITSSYVHLILRKAGFANPSRHAERDDKIIAAWEQGHTYASIQEEFGLSYGRVRQIISGHIGWEENHGR